MSIAKTFLNEFDHEAAITRKFLERVPPNKLTWRCHEKSHTIGELAYHIAVVPGNVVKLPKVDESPVPNFNDFFQQPTSVQQILDLHEKSIATVHEILPSYSDDHLAKTWSVVNDGKPVLTIPKVAVIRTIMLNHWIQHRGQLGVYLRLTGAKVPASYGPSGDES